MPGVPSGKGCDACRKQKKKCDLTKPSCSRCARLRIPCVGAGQQRYKFKDQSRSVQRMNSDSSNEQQSSGTATPDHAGCANRRQLSRTPSNDVTSLAAALLQAVKPETSWRFNIAYTYGGFIALIPQRLGRNPALDASVRALTEAHSDFCNARPASRSVLSKYSAALTELRNCLDDPAIATQSETLCSVMLLLITQSFIGTGGTRPAASHVVGMAKLLKVRGTQHDRSDLFESLLLLTLRGPVVFEGLWNEQIEFSESQWQELVENHWDDDKRPEGVLMRCMAKMPLYILRGRKILRGEGPDSTLAQEVSVIYHQLIEGQKELGKRLEKLDLKIQCAGPEMPMLTCIRDSATRIYTFQFAVIIIAGCVLGVVSEFTPELQATLDWCASEIYSYLPFCQKWRPLGSSYMLLCLSLAWMGTSDDSLKGQLGDAYVDLMRDFPATQDPATILESLESGARKFLSFGLVLPAEERISAEHERLMQIKHSTMPSPEDAGSSTPEPPCSVA